MTTHTQETPDRSTAPGASSASLLCVLDGLGQPSARARTCPYSYTSPLLLPTHKPSSLITEGLSPASGWLRCVDSRRWTAGTSPRRSGCHLHTESTPQWEDTACFAMIAGTQQQMQCSGLTNTEGSLHRAVQQEFSPHSNLAGA